jgi:epoxide hydrolase 4
MEIIHEFAKLDGLTLHYAKAGNGDKLLIFLHGFPEFWYEFNNQMEHFGAMADFTVVVPDLRGFNLSDKPSNTEDYSVKNAAKDIIALIAQLGYENCILVGHDWGGIIGWMLGITHPKLLTKLVIINAPHPAIFDREMKVNPLQQKASAYLDFFVTDDALHLLSANNFEGLVRIFFAGMQDKTIGNENMVAKYKAAWSKKDALQSALQYYKAVKMFGQGFEKTDYKITVPTLVIWGEKDRYLTNANLDGLNEYVQDLTIKKIENGSHWVVHEQASLVNEYIESFII